MINISLAGLGGADAFEIVVALLLIVVTAVALVFLYRNVAYEIKEMRKTRDAMKEREEDTENGEIDEIDRLADLKVRL